VERPGRSDPLRQADEGVTTASEPALGVLGAALACLSCLTPLAVVALETIGLSAWAGHLDAVLLPVLAVFVALAIYRSRVACLRTP
jgi:hypothetical protein